MNALFSSSSIALLLVLIATSVADDCCPYPASPEVLPTPSMEKFTCSEPVEITCANPGMYLEVAIVEDVQNLNSSNIIRIGYEVTDTFKCNTTSKQWTIRNGPLRNGEPKEFTRLACGYKLMTGEWIRGY